MIRHPGPVIRQHLTAVRLNFTVPDRRESAGHLKPEFKTTNTRKERPHCQHLTLRSPKWQRALGLRVSTSMPHPWA